MKRKKCPYLLVSFLLALCNCTTQKKQEEAQALLGRYLFFETNLSINNTKSCASCHSPQFAFTDGYRRSITALGENVLHNAPSLLNSVYLKYYDWANLNATNFETQIKRPLYNHQPIELGLDKHITQLKLYLQNSNLYPLLFKKAYPNSDSLYTLLQIENAICAYEKKLISTTAPYDKNELSASAKNGLKLFSNKELNCISCHPAPYFTLATLSGNADSVFANIGLYNVNNNNEYPTLDNGLFYFTKKLKDNGKFKIPSLRNVLLTAPYMHDGSIETIEEVIEMYINGGRNIDFGKNKGDGRLNKNKSKLIKGFTITASEKQDLINFLNSLTDSAIFYKQTFQNPFVKS